MPVLENFHRIASDRLPALSKRAELAASEVLILSPNEVFSDYISTVLPELGEDDLFQSDITQLMQPLMGESLVIGDRQGKSQQSSASLNRKSPVLSP